MAETRATVDVITAEVRVLSVGSRQVTLSVYNQLDKVAPKELTPFGRVTPKDSDSGYVYVVGKHTETGALVKSRRPCTISAFRQQLTKLVDEIGHAKEQMQKWESSADNAANRASALTVRAEEHLRGDRWSCAEFAEREAASYDAKAEAAETEAERLRNLAHAADRRADAADYRAAADNDTAEAGDFHAKAAQANANAEQWKHRMAELVGAYDDSCQRYLEAAAEWRDLPLIVLAGLR